jgi:hypothetical protein
MIWNHIFSLGQWFFLFRQLAYEELDESGGSHIDGDGGTDMRYKTLTSNEAICISEAVYKTLTLPWDMWFDHRREYERSFIREVSDALNAFLRIHSELLKGRDEEEVRQNYVSHAPRDFRKFQVLIEFINGNLVDGRRLFRANNWILGWTTADMRVGDFVAMILGVSWPIILRKSDDKTMTETYKVVGQAFVHDEWVHDMVETMRPRPVILT